MHSSSFISHNIKSIRPSSRIKYASNNLFNRKNKSSILYSLISNISSTTNNYILGRSYSTTTVLHSSSPSNLSVSSPSSVSSSTTKSKPYFITTPIYYVNSSPHVGHLYTSLVADAGARYHALLQNNLFPSSTTSSTTSPSSVLFSTGTDEHGQKVAEAAQKAGIPVKEFCDKITLEFQKLHTDFTIYPSKFIRTTDIAHTIVVQWLWKTLESKGYIYLGDHEGWYCQSDETFLSDSQVQTRKEYLISKNLYVPPPTPEEIAKQEKLERNRQRKLQQKLEKKLLKEQQEGKVKTNTESIKESVSVSTDLTKDTTVPVSPIKTDWTETELQMKVSSESGHPVERIKETNFLFRLSAFRKELNDLYATPITTIVNESSATSTTSQP